MGGSNSVVAISIERVQLEEVAVLVLIFVFVCITALKKEIFNNGLRITGTHRVVPIFRWRGGILVVYGVLVCPIVVYV